MYLRLFCIVLDKDCVKFSRGNFTRDFGPEAMASKIFKNILNNN